MKNYSILLAFLMFFMFSCSSDGVSYKAIPEAESSTDGYEMEKPEYVKSEEIDISENNIIKSDRKLIKEGYLSFETEDLGQTRKHIEWLTKKFQGYISKEYSFSYAEQKNYEMTVRIPAEHFDSFVDSLSVLIVKLENKNIQVKDVTEEYIDIEARLKTKRDVLARYNELLKQAKTVAEMLNVEKEMGILQTEIESLQGRLKYLQNQIGYSTLTITFFEYQSSEFGFWKKIEKAFVSGWKGLLWFFVIVVNLWPLWILLVLVGFFIKWLIKVLIKKKT